MEMVMVYSNCKQCLEIKKASHQPLEAGGKP